MSDPLASLPAPNPNGLPVFPGRTISGIATLQPGVYTGLVRLIGNAFVTMQPGTYIFQGGLLVSGNSQLVGNGVMLYVSGGRIEVQGNGRMSLTAPTSGTYAGITIFYARTNSNPLWLSGNAVQNIQGTVYVAPISSPPGRQCQFNAGHDCHLAGENDRHRDGYHSSPRASCCHWRRHGHGSGRLTKPMPKW